jgi:Zn-dependent protease
MRQKIAALFDGRETLVLQLGQIFGLRVRLHYTWLLAFVFITAAVVTQFSTDYPFSWRLMLGIAASLLFFLVMLIREFVINFIAGQKGAGISRVTLFALGGGREVRSEAYYPSLDLLLAVTGLVLNLMIAGVFLLIYSSMAGTGDILINVLIQWMAFICFMLAMFHFVPVLPLDGGRVLRSVIWKLTGNYSRTTLAESWAGWGIGIVIALAGIWVMVDSQEWFSGAFLLCSGLILQNSATHNRRNLKKSNPA